MEPAGRWSQKQNTTAGAVRGGATLYRYPMAERNSSEQHIAKVSSSTWQRGQEHSEHQHAHAIAQANSGPWKQLTAPASCSWRLSRTDPEAVRDMGSFPALLPLLPMPVKDLLTPALCTALVEACTAMTWL